MNGGWNYVTFLVNQSTICDAVLGRHRRTAKCEAKCEAKCGEHKIEGQLKMALETPKKASNNHFKLDTETSTQKSKFQLQQLMRIYHRLETLIAYTILSILCNVISNWGSVRNSRNLQTQVEASNFNVEFSWRSKIRNPRRHTARNEVNILRTAKTGTFLATHPVWTSWLEIMRKLFEHVHCNSFGRDDPSKATMAFTKRVETASMTLPMRIAAKGIAKSAQLLRSKAEENSKASENRPLMTTSTSTRLFANVLAVTHPGWHRSSQHQFAAVRRLHPLLSIEERACNEGRFNEPTGMHQALYRTFLKWDERSFTIRFRHFPRGLWPTHPWVPTHTMPPFLMRPSHGTLATSMGMWPLQIKQILAPNFWHATFTPTICIMSGPQRPKFLDLSQEFWNP